MNRVTTSDDTLTKSVPQPETFMRFAILIACVFLTSQVCVPAAELTTLRGEIRDESTGQPLAARLMIQHADGRWFFAKSADPKGQAFVLDRERSKTSVEKHTSLTAHPFSAELPPGDYTLTIERGKEYLTATRRVTIGTSPASVEIRLKRWINLAERHWYSGDTHTHRPVEDLIAPQLAEDVNVVLPMTQWVTTSHTTPAEGNRSGVKSTSAELVVLDQTHVMHPLNTEYEIFSVKKKSHTLGAVLIINHQLPLPLGVPPVKPVAEAARRQGALLDLEKHSWPWSMMIVPVMNVDLFELSNNHLWRTEFAFKSWTLDTKLPYGNLETDAEGFTEWGWTEFGLQTYYTLLNCGFPMKPTAGTAFGVHPVPLGFGRVYVQLPQGFRYEDWMKGLGAGRSFVTTGPMLFLTYNGEAPGTRFARKNSDNEFCEVAGEVFSQHPLDRIELIVNGETLRLPAPSNTARPSGGYVSVIKHRLPLSTTTSQWCVVRAFEKLPSGRFRFAHGSPVHFDLQNRPVRPRPEELQYLIGRLEQELARNKDVLAEDELAEYRAALEFYRRLR